MQECPDCENPTLMSEYGLTIVDGIFLLQSSQDKDQET
jgi:hypothetical protein